MAEREKKIYGIDLGTTYSCIAYVDEYGKPVIVPNAENQLTTPSVVYFEAPDSVVVGKAAKDVAELYPEKVVSTVKRVMGNPHWSTSQEDATLTPQDVSSFILRKLVVDAQTVTGDEIADVVITCPAYFGVTEKEATRQAGELAGLNVHHVIPEPTAAAIAYGMDQSSAEVVLVFDLGGGTFDVTVIEVKPDSIVVVCTSGDHDLGGRNWDEAIAQYFADEFARETGVPSTNLVEDMETWQELLTAAEEAKVALSSKEKHVERIRHGAERAVVEVTREKLDDLTGHMRERTIALTKEVILTAKDRGHARIDRILLVGGSTYMPQIQDAIADGIDIEAVQFDPNQAVAKGAAIFGFKCLLDEEIRLEVAERVGNPDAQLDSTPDEVRRSAEQAVAEAHNLSLPGIRSLTQKDIRNVSSKSFGVVAVDEDGNEEVANLITVDSPVPASVSQHFGTYAEGQSGVTIRCMENVEREASGLSPDSSTEVGTTQLLFERPLPKGSPIEVTFSLAADGLLSVHGKELTNGLEIDVEFQTEAILTPEQLAENRAKNMAITVA